MSADLERLRAAFENFLAGKREWGADLLDPDVEWDTSDLVFDLSGVHHGARACRRGFVREPPQSARRQ
jgi:hypothetical protein